MERTQITKIVLTILILAALAGAWLAVSYISSRGTQDPLEGLGEGGFSELPSKVSEEEAERVRTELSAPPEVEVDKEAVREELYKPSASGELSEEEKERIRAELRK